MYYTRKMIITILTIAAFLAAIGIWLFGLPLDVATPMLFSYDWFAANVFASGVFSMGVFSAGIFSAGVFSVGLFSIGIFSIGPFSVGTFSLALAYYVMKGRRKTNDQKNHS